jgi:hypothetical protein
MISPRMPLLHQLGNMAACLLQECCLKNEQGFLCIQQKEFHAQPHQFTDNPISSGFKPDHPAC